ncbi:hypothetical protein GCM10007301_06930 [Azorhizobium oxalatiphilum]|uniref:Carrier domain-containing protein n=1 Tax=Azorhizobium oxalatiphilum TaxID=980631 RepID=A0A917BL17_9HYPH|nr:condensation domain-containing protein [Azorhizobium oxalatiphilum]GGF50217.1 hypothetical protein GCM10007301_06930 [Azorhizobium oxalatiphilum]
MTDDLKHPTTPRALDQMDNAARPGRGVEPSAREERTWLRQQQDPDAVLRHVMAFRLTGGADAGRLAVAAAQAIEGLDLRYRFDDAEGLLVEAAGRAADAVRIVRVEDRAAALAAVLAAQAEPADLEHAPALRALLLLAPDEVILAIVAHRILDGIVVWPAVFERLSRIHNGHPLPAGVAGAPTLRRGPEGPDDGVEREARGPLLFPWLRRAVRAEAGTITDFGRAPLSDTDAPLAARHGLRLVAGAFAGLGPVPPTQDEKFALLAARLSAFLAGYAGADGVRLALAPPSAPDLGWRQVRLARDAADAAGTILAALSAPPARDGRSLPDAYVSWIADPAEHLRLDGVTVARLPLPSREACPDLAFAAGWAEDGTITLELVTGQRLSPAAGALLLEAFVDALGGVAIAGPAMVPVEAGKPEAPTPAAGAGEVARIILEEFRTALAAPELGEDDDFFDHGGHSLIATRIIGRLLGVHGIEVRFNDLFSHPTARGLSEFAVRTGAGATSASADAAADAAPVAPLSLAQASLWKAYEAFGCGEVFNLPFALRFLDPVDETVFAQAFLDILERHPGLRCLFRKEGDEVRQHVVPVSELARYKWFWTSQESEGVERHSEAVHHFDLAAELPLRLRFLSEPETGRQVLSFLFHHVVLDEWSVNLMMDELAFAYGQRAAGVAPVWEMEPAPFHAFAIGQHTAGFNDAHLAFWTDALRGAPKGRPVFAGSTPAAGAAPEGEAPDGEEGHGSAAGGWVEFRLEPQVADGLYALAREKGASLFNVVYAAIASSVHVLGGIEDLVIGTSASGRNDTRFFDTVGYFTTVVAHRVRFSGGMALGDLVTQVRNNINDSLPYADIPIDLVEGALGTGGERDHLFEIFIQLHAKNKLNGALPVPGGGEVQFRQVDPERHESLLGLHFEVMEDGDASERLIRVLMSYRSDHYSPEQVERLRVTTQAMFNLFAQGGSAQAGVEALCAQAVAG